MIDTLDVKMRELALDESAHMRLLASRYKQMGLRELSRWVGKNADSAMKWAGRT